MSVWGRGGLGRSQLLSQAPGGASIQHGCLLLATRGQHAGPVSPGSLWSLPERGDRWGQLLCPPPGSTVSSPLRSPWGARGRPAPPCRGASRFSWGPELGKNPAGDRSQGSGLICCPLSGVDPEDTYNGTPHGKGFCFISYLAHLVGDQGRFDKFLRLSSARGRVGDGADGAEGGGGGQRARA